MRVRIVVFLTALIIPVALFASTNELAVFANRATLDSTTESDPSLGLSFRLKFDSKTGYGASFNHFFSQNLSTELQAQVLRADTRIEMSGSGLPTTMMDAGTLDLDQYAALLHWYFGASTAAVRPHVGVGIARIQGGKLTFGADFTESGAPETIALQDKTTWTASAGVDVRAYGNAAVSLTAQYTPYKPRLAANPSDPVERIDLNPLTFAAGLRWRF